MGTHPVIGGRRARLGAEPCSACECAAAPPPTLVGIATLLVAGTRVHGCVYSPALGGTRRSLTPLTRPARAV
jgi:hypothetical protein